MVALLSMALQTAGQPADRDEWLSSSRVVTEPNHTSGARIYILNLKNIQAA
jgi:hypothetical protein